MENDQNENIAKIRPEENKHDNVSVEDKPTPKQENLHSVKKTVPSGNAASTRNVKPTADAKAASTTHNNVSETAKRVAKKQKIIFIVTAAVCLIILLYMLTNTAMCDTSPSMKGIAVVEEQLVTDYRYAIIGDSLFPILVVKVKNNSASTKKVSFEANFYADGALLGEDQASFVTLEPGDEAFLHAQSDKGYKVWTQHEYSYKITKWWIYTP